MEKDIGFCQREDKNKARLTKEYPMLEYKQFLLLEDDCRIFIDDISSQNDDPTSISQTIEELASSCSGKTYLCSVGNLTNQLTEQLVIMLANTQKNNLLLIFPGGGARSVKQSLSTYITERYRTIDISTRRKINASSGRVEGVDIVMPYNLNDDLSQNEIKTVLLIDDVIATGTTAVNIKEAFNENIDFFAASLLMFSPVQNKQYEYNRQQPTGIRGYKKIITPLVYQGLGKIPPVNSISTLIGQTDRSKMTRDRFCKRNVFQINLFNNIINKLQVLTS